jgi:hypothetical protein
MARVLAALGLALVGCSPDIVDGHFACDPALGRGCPDGFSCVSGFCVRGRVTDDGGLDASATDSGVDASATDSGSADGGPPLVVFVTSSRRTGDFDSPDPVLFADLACNGHAVDAGLAGAFRAWLSTSSDLARDRVMGAGPWVTRSGTPIFSSRSHLLSTTPPTNRAFEDEWGDLVAADAFVWTGSRPTGILSSSNCTNWTTVSGTGRGGYPNDAARNWTDEMENGCSGEYHLYCFETR